MRLSDALAAKVTSSTRSRGLEYFINRKVRAIEEHDGIVQATVIGSETYDVWLEPNGPLLRVSCTCPHLIDHLVVCKHVWAALLAAEAQGIALALDSAAQRVDFEIVADPFDLDDKLPEDDEYDNDGWEPPPQPARAAPRQPKEPPPWHQLLESVARHSQRSIGAVEPRGREGQLLFAVDVDASLAASTAIVELMTRDRKTNGDWGKPRAARLLASEIPGLPPGPDRQILERLLGARPYYGAGPIYEYGQLSRFRLDGALLADALPLMCAGGRCLARVRAGDEGSNARARVPDVPANRYGTPARTPSRADVFMPLAFDEGAPWQFAVAIRRDEAGKAYHVDGSLVRNGERMALSDPLLVLADGMLITRTHIARLDHGGAFGWLAALRRQAPVVVPLDQRAAVVDALLMQRPAIVDAPDELQVRVEDGRPQAILRLTPERLRPDQLLAEVSFDYGDGLYVPATVPNMLIRTHDASRIVRRDFSAEREHIDALYSLGFRKAWTDVTGRPMPRIAAHLLPSAVRALVAGGWHVEARGVQYRSPTNVSIAVSSGIDWFELDGHVDYGAQQLAIPALLAAAQRGEAFVELGDGSMGLLPDDWLRKHGALARLGSSEGGRLRFKSSHVALLDAMLAAQPQATCDEVFARARQELQAFGGIAPVDPPASFAGTLRTYQREGLGWLVFLRRFGFGGCLADDMGLGKTVMVLALLAWCRAQRNEPSPALVVAPRSLVFNWRQEAARFTPDLRVLDYTGIDRASARERIAEYDLVLTTYGTLRRDAAHLASVAFEYVILDEAQAIKNASSASAKAARLLTARHRLALSGTPVENHLRELWSLFEFLNPGVLGSATAFGSIVTSRGVDDELLSMLSRALRPFILRRTKGQVAPELPAKTEQTVYCELERPQRTLYNELRDHYRQTLLGRFNGGAGRAKLQVLEALLRLRQAACHPGLIDAGRAKDASAKLDVLVPQIAEAVDEGHKTLVFSQFTSFLALLRARLDEDGVPYEYLDGRTRDRESRVARFQTDPACRLFLISLKAGGVGLNLTAAEYVFLLDPWWNPAVEAQAIDRTHRIGQTRHVFAYRLIAKDTVEERVLELQQRKQELADAILTADESLIGRLNREDLELLLT